MTQSTISVCSAMVCAVAVATASPPEIIAAEPTQDLRLQDYRGHWHDFNNFREKPVLVVVFLGTECPLAKLYAPRLVELARQYEGQGVQFLGINSNQQDSITELAAYARIHDIPFPLLKDPGNRAADQFAAERTPEVFVLGAERTILYRGRIDDQYGIGVAREKPMREDLRAALDETLAGKPVSQPATQTIGCLIGRVRQPKQDSDVTYSNQIARLLADRCVECHREGEIAPFALTEYEEVAGWAEMIAEVVREERMPPWNAESGHIEFSNEGRLSQNEKQLIAQWVAAGAPEGDPADLPEPKTYVTGWQLPRSPDLVVPMRDDPFTVPAEGPVKYQYFLADPGFTEDKWIEAAEVLPGNRQVVHHVLVFASEAGKRPGEGLDGIRYLVAYVPGLRVEPFPAGMAKRIPAGSKLLFQVHYTPIGSEQQDLCRLGFCFADPRNVQYQVLTQAAVQTGFRIPPGADNHRVETTTTGYSGEMLLLSMTPHMHLRGKSFSFEALNADGTRQVLLNVPRYDFNWQTSYRLATPLTLAAETRMHCVAHYDNSDRNLANPDPTAPVTWGEQTWDEMMIGYFDVAVPFDPSRTGQASQPLPDLKPDPSDRARQLIKQ